MTQRQARGRTIATALVLVNWKGVFYERYLLDRHVTALEGANGAGKTTVMIAAYVAMLPDLSRLRFTNVGEVGATGGDRGIWGRLGEPGRPSYCALMLRLADGPSMVMGVHLQRRGAPVVELQPWIIDGLERDTSLQNVLLIASDGHDEIPTFAQLRARVVELGAKMQVFANAKDYFKVLFERGITPLRLAQEDARTKFNAMLRTSMTGGISRALTTQLRSFLLREEPGLSDSLTRMRSSLAICRRTRLEVQEARQLERELDGVFETGHGMIGSVLTSVRAEALAQRQALTEIEAQHEHAAHEVARLEDRHRGLQARQVCLRDELRQAESRKERAQQWKVRQEIDERWAVAKAELESSEREATGARHAFTAIQAKREAARQRVVQARETLSEVVRGIADAQAGMEALHRRAHAYRRAVALREQLRERLGDLAWAGDDAERDVADGDERVQTLDRELGVVDRDLKAVTRSHEDFERAQAALQTIDDGFDAGDAYKRALAVLAQAREDEVRVARLEFEQASLRRAKQVHDAQRILDEKTRQLGIEPLLSRSAWLQHVQGVQASLAELVHREQSLQGQAQAAARQAVDGREHIATLEVRATQWQRVVRARLQAEVWNGDIEPSDEALADARVKLMAEQRTVRDELEHALRRRESHHNEIKRLEGSWAGRDPELVELRDRLEAEFLADRYHDLERPAARRLEARMGAWADALVVEDLDEAWKRFCAGGHSEHLTRVQVVGPGNDVTPPVVVHEDGAWFVLRSDHGWQFVKQSDVPRIGRWERDERLARLKREIVQLDASIDALENRRGQLESVFDAVQELSLWLPVWSQGDPAVELEQARVAMHRAMVDEQATRTAIDETRTKLAEVRERERVLQGLAPALDALGHGDDGRSIEQLERACAAGEAAQARLATRAEALRVLDDHLDALRGGGGARFDREALEERRDALQRDRDHAFLTLRALREFVVERGALAWQSATQHLDEQEAAATVWSEQQAQVEAELTAAELDVEALDRAWEDAGLQMQQCDAVAKVAQQQVERIEAEQQAAKSPEEDQDVDGATVESIEQKLAELDEAERGVQTELAVLDERVAQARASLTALDRRREQWRAEVGPVEQAWATLQDRCRAAGVFETIALEEGAAAERAWSDARGYAIVLLDRLAAARGGQELVDRWQGLRDESLASPQHFVDAWLEVREWLERRLPASVVTQDALDGLLRLRRDLSGLEHRLEHQEADLRGSSSDVARNIEVQIRRAGQQVDRLNRHLETVSFGTIDAIRIQIERVETMDGVLHALSEGHAQSLLFQSTLPLEDAMQEVFRRYGGGGKAGAQKILDYREYIELTVEVRRRGSSSWETANPTRVSTGEAIGVGAALMMVILTEWERDAHLMRSGPVAGCLRLLFLDEANRLSQDNLGVLFDLCQTLDLQLLIAAPEVAHAQGNTTYRLVRRTDEQGGEEVVVTGRRSELPDEERT